jgi:hypothetical protein
LAVGPDVRRRPAHSVVRRKGFRGGVRPLSLHLICFRLRAELHGLVDFRQQQVDSDFKQRQHGIQLLEYFPDKAVIGAAKYDDRRRDAAARSER